MMLPGLTQKEDSIVFKQWYDGQKVSFDKNVLILFFIFWENLDFLQKDLLADFTKVLQEVSL